MNNQQESNASAGSAQAAAAQAAQAGGAQQGASEGGVGGPVPYDRFAAVVAERNELRKAKEEWEGTQKKHVETNSGLQKSLEVERRRNVAVRAALRAGLPVDMADRLQGDDVEALEADAAALARLVGASNGAGLGVPPAVGGAARKWDLAAMTPEQIREHSDELLRR